MYASNYPADLVQSVGVVLSAIVIYFYGSNNGQEVTEWNAYHLFDPIATYLFSILSLIATLPVVRNCYYLIMESTPAHLNLDDLRREFEKIEGVIDVHDIHVWDLKPGKTLMIAHVLAKKDTERGVLTRLTDLCRKKRIYHSTFQV
jgi:Co/Zn/Cd efflux system component